MTARAGLGLAVLAAAGCAGLGSPGAADFRPSAAATHPAAVTPEPAAASEPATDSAPPADAVPWDTVDAFYDAERGRYTEVTGISGPGYAHQILMQETVRFDLAAPFLDRTVKAPAEMLEADTPPGDLRFVYTDEVMLMWHPLGLERCGTHWIDMTDAAYGDVLGFDLRPGDLLAVKPLEVLASALDEPRHIDTTSAGSTYQVTLPADMGMGLSSAMLDDPEALDALLEIDVVAEVVLPRSGGSLTLSVDFTEAHRVLDAAGDLPADAAVRTVWTITPDIPEFDTSLPDDVAEGSCLDPGTAT